MDLIGEAGPLADAELMAAAVDVVRAFGLGPDAVRLRISDRRVVRALLLGHGVTEGQLPAAYAAIDKSERDPRDVIAQRLAQGGFTDAARDGVFQVAGLKGLHAVRGALATVAATDTGDALGEAVGALEAMGLRDFVDVDLTIVRGLAYYTGIVFELFDAGKSLRAICGGGRYDGLLKALGGVDLPALGFGMGDVVLAELLRDRKVSVTPPGRLDAFLVAVSADDVGAVLRLAHELRDRDIGVEYGLRHAALRKQLELAAARGAPRAIIIGPEERKAGVVVVRDLTGGTEERVPMASLLNGYFR
jgi:histidyl-tRNA synthetase